MKEFALFEYWRLLWKYIPSYVYEICVIALVICVIICVLFYNLKSGIRYISRLILSEYVLLLYCSTVFFRYIAGGRDYNFIPFWSYYAFFCGDNPHLLPENIMNIFIFVPLGLLLGFSCRYMTFNKAIIIGCAVSLGIELLQLLFIKGFSEFDDVMHNTLGCVIGYWLYTILLRKLFKKYAV